MARIFQQHPINKHIHALHASRVAKEFKLSIDTAIEHLSIRSYLDTMPRRFFCKDMYNSYMHFLESAFTDRPKFLIEAFHEHADALELAHHVLNQSNSKPWHDTYIPTSTIARIQWVDNQINPELLRLWEASLHGFLLLHSQVRRRQQGKGVNSMDVYNVVQETKNTSLAAVARIYDHNIRNGIGHGKVRFTNDDVSYRDKKGIPVQYSIKKLIRLFDDLLDALNGMALAHRTFWAMHQDELLREKLQLPRSILFEELSAKVNMNDWRIEACLESECRAPKRQLEIHLRNSFWDYDKVQYWAFYTAYWAERLTGSFDSIFLQFSSSTSNSESWAGFNAEQMRTLRKAGAMEMRAYKDVLEGNLLFFIPKISLPKLFRKIGTYWMGFRCQYDLWLEKREREKERSSIKVRHCAMHSKGWYAIIADAVVIIPVERDEEAQIKVRERYNEIVQRTITACRHDKPWYAITRYLPICYIRIMVYADDKRRRQLKDGGLPKELIGTVGFNTSQRIKNIEILGGTMERIGKYRLVWNSRWRGLSRKQEQGYPQGV